MAAIKITSRRDDPPGKKAMPENPRKYIDSTYMANYGGRDPQELFQTQKSAVPGVRNTPAQDALMRNFAPSRKGITVYNKRGIDAALRSGNNKVQP